MSAAAHASLLPKQGNTGAALPSLPARVLPLQVMMLPPPGDAIREEILNESE